MNKSYISFMILAALIFTACSDDDKPDTPTPDPAEELSEEWYSGGKMGTVFNTTSSAYEQSTPMVDADSKLSAEFQHGESFFEDAFVTAGSE